VSVFTPTCDARVAKKVTRWASVKAAPAAQALAAVWTNSSVLAGVGSLVGTVGGKDGALVGDVGASVGPIEGGSVGSIVGALVGTVVVGIIVGKPVGISVGSAVGSIVGSAVNDTQLYLDGVTGSILKPSRQLQI
jgi:hypothetical protein